MTNCRRGDRQHRIRIRRRKKISDVAFIGRHQGVLRGNGVDRRWIKLNLFSGSHRCRYLGGEQPAKKCKGKSCDPDRPDQSRPQRPVAFTTAKERVQSTLILSYRQSETAFCRVSHRIVVNAIAMGAIGHRQTDAHNPTGSRPSHGVEESRARRPVACCGESGSANSA